MERTKPLLWEYGRQNDYRFPNSKDTKDRSPNLAIRDANWKLLVNADGTGIELYDLAADPMETNNLAAQQPDLVNRLKTRILAWRKSLP
jgi:arylsulfatase A-like enzyme